MNRILVMSDESTVRVASALMTLHHRLKVSHRMPTCACHADSAQRAVPGDEEHTLHRALNQMYRQRSRHDEATPSANTVLVTPTSHTTTALPADLKMTAVETVSMDMPPTTDTTDREEMQIMMTEIAEIATVTTETEIAEAETAETVLAMTATMTCSGTHGAIRGAMTEIEEAGTLPTRTTAAMLEDGEESPSGGSPNGRSRL
jgi:hypothetical protein